MKKRLLAGLLAATLAISMTGCSGLDQIIEQDTTNVNGIVEADQVSDGIYVLTEDGTHIQPNTDNQNFKNGTNSASKDRLTWSVSGNKVIPVCYADDKLVYYAMGEIPEYFDVEQFAGGAYTIGIALMTEASDGGVEVNEDGLIVGSDAQTQLESHVGKGMMLRIATIDGEQASADYLSYSGSFTQLEKNKDYTLGVYVGTHYGEITTKADARIFSSYKTTTTAGYTLTKDGYAVIDVSNLEDGFYSIDGKGLIEIRRSENRPQS